MDNSQVAHIWAQRLGGSKKGSHFYFEGDTIFSYGAHYPAARFYDSGAKSCVLINARGYSSTTAKHMSYVRGALDYSRFAFVANVPHVEAGKDSVKHLENLQYIIDQTNLTLKKCAKARQRLANDLAEFEALRETAILYGRFFKIKLPCALPVVTAAQQKEFEKRMCAADEARALAKQRASDKESELLSKWVNDPLQRGTFFSWPVKLRINGDQIETSHGAKVPLALGIMVAKDFLADKLRVGTKIAHFEVNEVYFEYVKIGCHVIQRAEIERLIHG